MASSMAARLRPLVVKGARGLKQAEYWLLARVALSLLWALRKLPADAALNFMDRAARRLGPFVGRHRTALDNLRKAYPEKSEAEIAAIASDMWANMARLAGEYIFLDQLFDYDHDAPAPGRVEVEGADIFMRLVEEKKPIIFFTGHIGNFELLPVAASTFGLPVTVLFRAPNNPYIADYIFSTRAGVMGDLMPSRAGAAFGLARVLEAGGNVGALVDQKFHKGIPGTFFGRACMTSPLVAKLARQYECDIHPAHVIRLPGNRFRVILSEKLDVPRNEKGAVDVPALTQRLNDTVEEWVRAHPGQWMWFHKRWKGN